jgi:hypothetical protein
VETILSAASYFLDPAARGTSSTATTPAVGVAATPFNARKKPHIKTSSYRQVFRHRGQLAAAGTATDAYLSDRPLHSTAAEAAAASPDGTNGAAAAGVFGTSFVGDIVAIKAARTIDANAIHGGHNGEQQFWTQLRTYRTARHNQSMMPSWDRFAQTLIMFTRRAPRVLPAEAFRLMAVFMKFLLVVRVPEMRPLLLPLQAGANAQGLIGQAMRERDSKKPTDAAAAAPTATEAANADEPPKP